MTRVRIRFRGRLPADRSCEQCGDPFDQEARASKRRFCPRCARLRDAESTEASRIRRMVRQSREDCGALTVCQQSPR